ncbi:LysR family substrate-binding domain-containing protein [Streptomyces sp. NPDC056682]|uniref:LysR family substrate-binding domain-containing protein n=1 Tax=Streptomyces sp. NPDC056682 TaxID=3345909 RepID=UPI0036ACDFB2
MRRPFAFSRGEDRGELARPGCERAVAAGQGVHSERVAGEGPVGFRDHQVLRGRCQRPVLGAAQEGSWNSSRTARSETGRLRLGFIASALLDPLPGVLSRFGRERPDVRLELHEMATSRSSSALVAGELDVALTLGPPRGAGAERLVSVPIGRDHVIAAVSTAHPYAGQPSVTADQLRRQPLIVSAGEDEPAVVAGLRTLLGTDSSALGGATVARDVHTIIGLAASGVGVGLGPSRMRAVPRPGVRFCEVTPRTPLPDLVLSFAGRDRSPVLRAFLDTIRKTCPDVGAALNDRLQHHT